MTNRNGFFILQVYYDSGQGEKTEGLAYGISTEFKVPHVSFPFADIAEPSAWAQAVSGSTVKLHAVWGGTLLRVLRPSLCAKGEVKMDCTGPTLWSFACSKPYN